MLFEEKDKEFDKKFEERLKKHKYLYKIAFSLHLSSRPIAFFGLILAFILSLVAITGIVLISNNADSLKTETDQLCQSITDFMANRELERPNVFSYNYSNAWLIDSNNFDTLTKSMYTSKFSNDVLDCYNQYKKRGIEVDSIMYNESLNPTNLFSIYDTISYLKLLENK